MGELPDDSNEDGKNWTSKIPARAQGTGGGRCKRGEETVGHVLTECPQFKEMRKTMWANEVRKARLNWIDLRTILTTPIYVKKAALFMQKTDLLGQFRGLTWSEPTQTHSAVSQNRV